MIISTKQLKQSDTEPPSHFISYPHWGQGGLETSGNILSTLQALVEGTHHLPANNRLGTFQMFPDHVFDLEPMGTFMQHLKFPNDILKMFPPHAQWEHLKFV